MRLVSTSAIALALLATTATGQLSSGGAPVRDGLREAVPIVMLPSPDLAAYRAEDARAPFGPYRYGAVVSAPYGIDDSGAWEMASDGTLVWRLSIASPGAYSLGLLFEQFELPVGGRLFVTSADGRVVMGAFTSATAQPNGMLPISPVAGDRVVLQYDHDPSIAGEPKLRLQSVVHDYRDILALRPPSTARSSGCFIDINCSEGDPYQDIKRAVIGLYKGGFVCSGSILNNTARDGAPYMLTAHHCGSMTNAVIAFDYENPTCGGGGASNSKTLAGAVLLAESDPFDSQLYRLNQSPPNSYKPFFAGWARGNTPVAPAISISHPNGLPKKIAIDNDGVTNFGTDWLAHWDKGLAHYGSSGSPLFNGYGRVIGPACCVTNFNCGQQGVIYGQFHRFFNAQGLAQWLDPLALGAVGVGGHDPLALAYNGSGANPDLFKSSAAILGGTWTGRVDTSAYPATTSTLVVGYTKQQAGVFGPAGEVLVGGPGAVKLFQATAPIVVGKSTHMAPVPNDPALAGAVAFLQAVLLGGGTQATNAIQLTIY